MTLQESRPVSDPLLALQQFEQAFAQARQLLIDTQTLSPTHAGNISLRVGDQEKLLIASLAGPDAGTAVLLDFDLRTHQGTLSANLQEVAALHVAMKCAVTTSRSCWPAAWATSVKNTSRKARSWSAPS